MVSFLPHTLGHGDNATLTEDLRKTRWRLLRSGRACVVAVVWIVALAFGISEALSQRRESRYVEQVAQKIIRQANATDATSMIIALRDYLRHNVTRDNYPVVGRPFLRDTAAYALQTGHGRCGESTRAFINMAESLGIHAQRLYLEGQKEHVVALVTLNDGRQLIVDSIEPAYFPDVEELHQVTKHPNFKYYSSINLHRWLKKPSLPANTYDPPGLTYFLENPHALKALFCFSLSVGCAALGALSLARRYLRARRPIAAPALSAPNRAPALAVVDR